MDERYETLIANLAAIAAGQQILIDRLLRDSAGDVAGDAEVQRIAQDARVLIAATRLFLRAGPPAPAADEEEEVEEGAAAAE